MNGDTTSYNRQTYKTPSNSNGYDPEDPYGYNIKPKTDRVNNYGHFSNRIEQSRNSRGLNGSQNRQSNGQSNGQSNSQSNGRSNGRSNGHYPHSEDHNSQNGKKSYHPPKYPPQNYSNHRNHSHSSPTNSSSSQPNFQKRSESTQNNGFTPRDYTLRSIQSNWEATDNAEFDYLKTKNPFYTDKSSRLPDQSSENSINSQYRKNSDILHQKTQISRAPPLHTNSSNTSTQQFRHIPQIHKITHDRIHPEDSDELFYLNVATNTNCDSPLNSILKESTKTLAKKVHQPFEEKLATVHQKAIASQPVWVPPKIERQEWLAEFSKTSKNSRNGQNAKNGQNGSHNSKHLKTQKNPEKRPKNPFPDQNLPEDSHNESKRQTTSSIDNDWSEVMRESGRLIAYIRTKKAHPKRLHNEIWYNEKGECNDGDLCKCDSHEKTSGIRHSIYPGEKKPPKLRNDMNNLDKLHHYVLAISVKQSGTNPQRKYNPTSETQLKCIENYYFPELETRTKICHEKEDYYFEGFSVFSHLPLDDVMCAETMRFHARYNIHFIPQRPPRNFCIKDLLLFQDYLFKETLELYDWLDDTIEKLDPEGKTAKTDKTTRSPPKPSNHSCQHFYFLPRFIHRENPSEFWSKMRKSRSDGERMKILSMRHVLGYLQTSFKPLIPDDIVPLLRNMDNHEWNSFIQPFRGQLAMLPGARPSTIRIDQIDRNYVPDEDSVSKEEDKVLQRELDALSDYEDDNDGAGKKSRNSGRNWQKNGHNESGSQNRFSTGNSHKKDFRKTSTGEIDTRWWQDKGISKDLNVKIEENYKSIQGHTQTSG